MSHARLAPSSAAMWANCPHSVSLQARYPEDEESEAAREGTAAHWYMAEALAGRTPALGTIAPNGLPITDDMIDGAQALLLDVAKVRDCVEELHVETRVEMSLYVHPDNWGTPDVFGIDRTDAQTIYLWDYKFGHRYVEPYRNWQLVDYVIGIVQYYGLSPSAGLKVRCVIAQPRNYDKAGPLRIWETDVATIMHLATELAAAAENVDKYPDRAHTGDYCRDCTGRHACGAFRASGMNAVDVSMQSDSHDMPPESVAVELRILKAAEARIKARLSGLEAQAEAAIRNGKIVPGWAIEQKPGNLEWTAPTEEVVALGQLLGVDLSKPGVVTPTQAINKLKVDAALVHGYAARPPGKAKLVVQDTTTAPKKSWRGSPLRGPCLTTSGLPCWSLVLGLMKSPWTKRPTGVMT